MQEEKQINEIYKNILKKKKVTYQDILKLKELSERIHNRKPVGL